MTLKKCVIFGIVIIALACIAVGKPEAGLIGMAGLIGFLKDDKE